MQSSLERGTESSVSNGGEPPRVDVLVVGSGASGVNAAYPLVEAGFQVRMLDVGTRDDSYEALIPARSFQEIRHTDPNQHRYLLGDRFDGIPFGPVGAGAQLTPPRQFVCRDTNDLTPVVSDGFTPVESLALGGLASAWGAGCPPFADSDFAGFPISASVLQAHYEAVAQRIGISGARDDLLPFLGDLQAMQPPAAVDSNAQSLLRQYERVRPRLNRSGFHLGRPRLALLTREHRGRGPTQYWDMDFWADKDRAVYRPRWTVEELCTSSHFEYRASRFVEAFAESGDDIIVRARNLNGGEAEVHRARTLILAAGTFGTTRIVLRSLGLYGRRVPFVCNPHTYAAMLNLRMLGQRPEDRRHSLAQLCVVHAPRGTAGPTTVGHIYSYRSLLTFRLAKETRLPLRDSLGALRLLLPALTLLILQHADEPSPKKYCVLVRGQGPEPDRLELHYERSLEERQAADRVEREVVAQFRRLRCLCLQRSYPGDAASVHYAGTLPMTETEQELTTDPSGRLRGTRSVYVADGSAFPRLPSRGHTFTMMANANRVGCLISERLRG